ncbi:MAG TPA: 2OG-Fe(II) oxygenase [Rhizomicrobium sp.]|nr:2OG-Fe(II) oxygenase [Rhizomicrobium sp.]
MSTAAVRAPDQPALADLVMVTPHALSAEHCTRLIERFEAAEEQQICEKPGGHSFTQIEITKAWPDEHAFLLPLFLEHFQNYQRCTGSTYWPRNIGYEHLRVKRYLPNGRDWFAPHVDVVDQLTARRFMTAFIYLNAPKGGETVFPTLGLVIPPETGKLLSFPPLWLFPHEGRAPVSAPKYILHTYLCYGE